jgi:hypothetical protein
VRYQSKSGDSSLQRTAIAALLWERREPRQGVGLRLGWGVMGLVFDGCFRPEADAGKLNLTPILVLAIPLRVSGAESKTICCCD